MKRSLFVLTLALLLCSFLSVPASAKAKGGSSHSSTHSTKSAKNDSRKTEHVSGYTKKNGTKVKPYKRRPASR